MSSPVDKLGLVLEVGPDLRGQGGIASVIRTYADSSLAERFNLAFAATWTARTGPLRYVDQFFGVAGALWKIVFVPGPLLVHVHMSSRGSFWRKATVLSAAWLRGRPAVLHLHGGQFHTFAERGGPVSRLLIRHAFQRATVVAVLSPEWGERVTGFARRLDTVVLPNPVSVPAEPARPAQTPTVLFLGRLGPMKGTPELLEAIRQLQTEGLEARWVLAGDGAVDETRAAVCSLPDPESVEVPGWLCREEVADRLAGASVFCLPSHFEGKPVALLEAMGYGLACVATPVGGIPDIIRDEDTGLSVPVGDVSALTDALRRTLTDGELRQRLGASARDLVMQEYDSEVVADTVAGLYESLLGNEPKPVGQRTSSVHRLRSAYESLPRPARSIAGAAARHLPIRARYGDVFIRTMHEIESVSLHPEELPTRVEARLAALTDAAVATGHWPQVFREAGLRSGPRTLDEIAALPLMDKEQVRALGDSLVSSLVPPAARKWVTTGGTSGRPLGLWIERDASVTDWAYTISAWGRLGYILDEPRAVLRGVRLGAGVRRDLVHYEAIRRELYLSVFDMDDTGLRTMRRALRKHKPRFLHGYPSAMEVLGASYQAVGEAPPQLKGLLCVSENLTPDLRRRLESMFGCRALSFYGMTEKGAFAAECEHSHELHVEPLFGHVELIDNDGHPIEKPGVRGEIVVTSLVTRAMPLFRYRTGDFASWSVRSQCECGRPHRRLERIEGRWRSEHLVGHAGEKVSMTALNLHSNAFDQVRRFQFRQEIPGEATLLIEPGPGFSRESDEVRLLDELSGKLDGRVKLAVEVVDRVQQTPLGKQLFIDQRIGRDAQ